MTNLKKYLYSVFFLISTNLFLISCYKKESETNQNRLKISINLISYNEKELQIFYKTNTDDSYTEELSIKKLLSGKNQLQNVLFELPKNIKPKNIRIDIGETEHDSIRIEKIEFKYKNLVLKGSYKSWFDFNEDISFSKDSSVLYLNKKNASFDPQLNGNQLLNTKLIKLYQPDINDF